MAEDEVIHGEVVAPKYEIIDFRGAPARQYPDGSIRDDRGRLLQLPDKIKDTVITKETAVGMARRRKEKILEAIEQGIMDITAAKSPSEAIAYIVSKRAQVAMTDDGRAGNDAAKIVLMAVDALQDRRVEEVKTERHEYVIDPETLDIISQIAEGKRE